MARMDKEFNHAIVCEAFAKHITAHGRPPTIKKLSEDSGLGTTAVKKHLKRIKETPLSERIEKYELMFDDIMSSLAITAKSGDVPAAKLFFQMLDKLVDRKEIDLKGNPFAKYTDDDLRMLINRLEKGK